MKSKTSLILILTLLAFTHCDEDEESCEKNVPEWCDFVDLAPGKYDPVCGCDGNTYRNAAFAECIGGITVYKKGVCQ